MGDPGSLETFTAVKRAFSNGINVAQQSVTRSIK
jgi:hypothetical protein